jgi:hypothetical protein
MFSTIGRPVGTYLSTGLFLWRVQMAEFKRYAEMMVDASIAKATQAEATVLAGEAGVFHDVTMICLGASGGANTFTIKDGTAGTTRLVYTLPSGGGVSIPFWPPMPSATAANDWTVTLANATATNVTIQAVRRN